MFGPCDILLVEDNPDDAFFFRHAASAEALGTRVMQVNHGEMAQDFLLAKGRFNHRQEEDPPQVIVTDLKMPFVNGLELTRWLKGHEKFQSIPIVMLTSSNEERDEGAAYSAGVKLYRQKPHLPDGYRKIVHEINALRMPVPESLPAQFFTALRVLTAPIHRRR